MYKITLWVIAFLPLFVLDIEILFHLCISLTSVTWKIVEVYSSVTRNRNLELFMLSIILQNSKTLIYHLL